MKKTDSHQVRICNWFMEFLNDDLDQMHELEFEKRILEAQFYFMQPQLMAIEQDFNKEISELLKSKMGKRLFPKFPKNYPWKENLKAVQSELRKMFLEIIKENKTKLYGRPTGSIRKLGDVTLRSAIIDGRFYTFYDYNPRPSKLVECAIMKFWNAFTGLPMESIKNCEECENYFLHLSKKPKIYCNPRCASRAVSRRRREKDPETYRRKQREIMRQKYREKKAAELRVPVEKIKIKKRVK